MKTKSFRKLIEKRLSKEEIAEIEAEARLEVEILKSMQKFIMDSSEGRKKKRKAMPLSMPRNQN